MHHNIFVNPLCIEVGDNREEETKYGDYGSNIGHSLEGFLQLSGSGLCLFVICGGDILQRNLQRLTLHSIAPARMSPETTHKFMGFYMEARVLGVIL